MLSPIPYHKLADLHYLSRGASGATCGLAREGDSEAPAHPQAAARQKTEYPDIAWPLRFRILHEIALGVNYLHNMNPPLLHHNLKTQNILLDNEFHVKIADFGLSKWRMMSLSQSRSYKSAPEGGTIIYMPPENYEPGQKSRASVKHDIYSYAVIMWEVLSRKQPFEGMYTFIPEDMMWVAHMSQVSKPHQILDIPAIHFVHQTHRTNIADYQLCIYYIL